MTDLGDFSEYDGGADASASGDDTTAGDDGQSLAAGDVRESAAGAGESAFEETAVEPRGEDVGIGALCVSQGLRVAEDEEDTTLKAYVTRENRSSVRIGGYLLAPYPDRTATAASQTQASRSTSGETLFCRITGLEYAQQYHADDATEIHARRAMRTDGIEEADYKFVASLEPVAILYDDDGELKRRMTDRVPTPQTVIKQADDTEEIKTGLKIPDEGVFLGHLSVGGEKVRTAASPPTIDYRLKDDYEAGDPLVFRHTLVAGGTGSGKTHGAKNVLRQYLADERTYPMEDGRSVQPAVVQFDPQDEYAQMHDDNPDLDDAFARRLEREGVAYGGVEETTAFVPKVGSASYAASHHRAEQVEFTIPFSMVHDNPWLVAGSGLNDNQYGALVSVLLPRFRRDYGPNGTYDEFTTFLDDPALREELDESGRVHEATFDAVRRRVFGFSHVFDQDARPITDLISEFVRPGGLSVVPTYHITDSRATEAIVLALSSLLIDEKLSNDPTYDRIKETPLILGMDEAHNFLTDADSVQAGKVIKKFTEAAKQGRKERLGLFLITQDPQDIDDAVFKQINTTIVLNLGDEDAIKSVNIPSNLESKVPYMEKGQMVVYSPDNSEPVELIGLPNCLTRHGRD
ncbi:ATP-binding protein [Natrarchaeobaculum sulfurireducens]|uniref:Bipolar DNA helicase HerA n=1 Tax=Natrarchaeobaculum sulfurireducens TaxID=2044521 RepID=A0A346PIV7_9EURY|nr:ATP-binding protein [Natrarchaeobaculum sulfurireducens]AXR79452.1 HerA helicase [Natrarchaeobaculum sulfurireducens]AXR83222.1 Bipolar DNA helicase HerA [Natrarchaeobaculum sulfurireducens]